MRPIDLARRAGVSTQQVRNLEAAAVLPGADRTLSGYRHYGDGHLSALLAYQALALGHGVPTARAVMTAITHGRVHEALAEIDASHAALHEQRRALDETEKALSAATGLSTGGVLEAPSAPGARSGSAAVPATGAPGTREPMLIGELARHLGVRPSALRVWEQAGLLAPVRQQGTGHRLYSAADVRDARVVHLLRQGRYLFDRIRPVIEGIRGSGSADALRAAIDERRVMLNHRALVMLDAAGRLRAHLDLIGANGRGLATG